MHTGAVGLDNAADAQQELENAVKEVFAVDGADFGPSRNGDGAASAATHSLRECGRAMARRRGQFAYDWLPVPPMFCTHMHGKLM